MVFPWRFTNSCQIPLHSRVFQTSGYLTRGADGGMQGDMAAPLGHQLLTRRPASADRTARRQFQATGQPVSQSASDAMTSRLPRYEASVCNAGASNAGRSLCVQISRERGYPLPIYWYHSTGNWLRYNFAAESFYIIKLCSRLFVQYCRNCPKDDKFRYFIPILRNFSISYGWGTTRQNCVKTRCYQEGVISSQDFRGKGLSLGNIFWFLQN